jgi:GDPmannose 4,6-dehydratase
MTKRALITGIAGQDGSYLAEILLDKGYEVFGLVRRSSSLNRSRIDHLTQPVLTTDNPSGSSPRGRLQLLYGDMNDGSSLRRIVREVQPTEIYNLASQSHVRVSFETPEQTVDVNAFGVLRLLEAIREAGIETRFYQASSSELFGKTEAMPQNETTSFHPRSPYACAKLFGYWITINYREAYGMYATNGICSITNHRVAAKIL